MKNEMKWKNEIEKNENEKNYTFNRKMFDTTIKHLV